MDRRTKRRAFLGGLAVAGVGGAGYLLRAEDRQRRARWLRPTEPIDDSETFAHVSGIVRQRQVMDVQVAMRETPSENTEITLFADSADPFREIMPGPWGFWRFDVDVSGRVPGEYALTVDEDRLTVTLGSRIPPHLRGPRLELTTQGIWRSQYVAHAYGYTTGRETGRLDVAFRQPTGSTAAPLDSLVVRTPSGDPIGTHTPPAGVYETTVDLEPLEPFDGLGVLQGVRDGDVVDELDLLSY